MSSVNDWCVPGWWKVTRGVQRFAPDVGGLVLKYHYKTGPVAVWGVRYIHKRHQALFAAVCECERSL